MTNCTKFSLEFSVSMLWFNCTGVRGCVCVIYMQATEIKDRTGTLSESANRWHRAVKQSRKRSQTRSNVK